MSDLKGKGKAGKPKASRSSRACENCRKNKAKCVPNLNDLNGGCVACTMSSTVCKFAETKKRSVEQPCNQAFNLDLIFELGY